MRWAPLVSERARVAGDPRTRALIRGRAEDFAVQELLGFEASGDGEHVLLQVEKNGCNTVDVARALARHAGLPVRGVGYSGLKDKHAVCVQWFSLPYRAGIDWGALEWPGIRVLKAARHNRKLKRGAHKANSFQIAIEIESLDETDLVGRLKRIRSLGVPNYFGEQRFGRRYTDNVCRLLAGNELSRFDRGITLSAVRSDLFNRILDRRVRDGCWDVVLPGEYVNLEGSGSGFATRAGDPEIAARVKIHDIHPTGPMYGAGRNPAVGEAALLEESVVKDYQALRELLVRKGLKMERRATRCSIRGLDWRIGADGRILHLAFVLRRGQYATSVLREILDYHDVTRKEDERYTGWP